MALDLKIRWGGGQKHGGHNLPPGWDRVNRSATMLGPAVRAVWSQWVQNISKGVFLNSWINKFYETIFFQFFIHCICAQFSLLCVIRCMKRHGFSLMYPQWRLGAMESLIKTSVLVPNKILIVTIITCFLIGFWILASSGLHGGWGRVEFTFETSGMIILSI